MRRAAKLSWGKVAGMRLEELREQVVFYGKQLAAQGMTLHTGGNLSARDPQSGLIAIKPSARPYEAMRPQDVAVIDEEGNLVEGPYKPSSEWRMHTMLYRQYPHAGAVVHCHSTYCCALAAVGREIPLVNHELCCYCSQAVRVAPFALAGSVELGRAAIQALGADNNVALLQNHGQVAIGATLWHAMDAACAAELAARMACIGSALGPLLQVPEQERQALRRHDPMQSGGRDIAAV